MSNPVDEFSTLSRFPMIEKIRDRWTLVLGLGIGLIVLGLIATALAASITKGFMLFIGWLMLVGGVITAAQAFTDRDWDGFFVDLLGVVFYTIVGLMILTKPDATAAALTLLILCILFLAGVFRVASALLRDYPNWLGLLIHGILNITLAGMIWQGWPESGRWVLGLFLGVELVLNGLSVVWLSLLIRQLAPPSHPN